MRKFLMACAFLGISSPCFAGEWVYKDTLVGMEKIPGKVACTNSSNANYFSEGNDSEKLTLCIRSSKADDGGFVTFIYTEAQGEFQKSISDIEFKFKDKPIITTDQIFQRDNERDTIWISDSTVFATLANGNDHLTVQVPSARNGDMIFEFDTSGLDKTVFQPQ